MTDVDPIPTTGVEVLELSSYCLSGGRGGRWVVDEVSGR